MKPISCNKLEESGLLFEINRSILYPLGLCLEIRRDARDPENPQDTLVLFQTDDPDGVLFTQSSFTDGATKFKLYMKQEGEARLIGRQRITGFVRQTRSDQ